MKVLIFLIFVCSWSYSIQAYGSGLDFDNTVWQYDSENDIYWQTGVVYCAKPETPDYESLGIFVPGEYLSCEDNGNGTFTCSVNLHGTVNGFNVETAPIVLPVDTPGYSAQSPPASCSNSNISPYLKAGLIYVKAGMRGRNNGYDEKGNLIYSGGAPWGVTDLKAAIRYYRYNKEILPGNTRSMFTFGHSGGGAQSTLMGAAGDSPLFNIYLESIGAAMTDASGKPISDAIAGVMAWCPVTCLDYADQAYEWNMGQFMPEGTRDSKSWRSALSKDLAFLYAKYINGLGLNDEYGNVLTLEKSDENIYMAGSYYDYLLSVIEESLNNFLSDTTFPHTVSFGGSGFPGIAGEGAPPDEAGDTPCDSTGEQDGTISTTYETAQDYIASLNSDEAWVTYDADTNKATVSSVGAFVTHMKSASKAVPAFDDIDLGQAENAVFGNDDRDALHFDIGTAILLHTREQVYASYPDWDESIINEYDSCLRALDKFGVGIMARVNMYNPLYYLLPYYYGYGRSHVAGYWRINSGIEQGDTAITIEMNLALALKNHGVVKDVEFQAVWAQGHTQAERSGDATENVIAWVISCAGQMHGHQNRDKR